LPVFKKKKQNPLTPGKTRPPRDIYAKYYQLAFDAMGARISSNSWDARNGSYIV